MKTVKSLLLASSVSISICTLLSTLNHLFFSGFSEFYLVGPTGGFSSAPGFNLMIVLNYALVGIIFWTGAQLIKHDHFGFTKMNLIHFVLSFIGFAAMMVLDTLPIGIPQIPLHIWLEMNGGLKRIIMIPITTTFTYYLIAWVIAWLYYRYQSRKLNKKLNS